VKPLPDPYPIEPLAKPPNCTITVPGSKSITNRALILAALAKGKCTLRGALWADDTQVMVDSLQKLGFEVTVEPDPNEECNRTITVVGHNGEIPAKKAELYVGNAGTAARFLTALVCLGHGEYTIRGDPRMHERPMKELFDVLIQQGAAIESNAGSLPARINANGLREGKVVISNVSTSQFASALELISRPARLKISFKLEKQLEELGEQFEPQYVFMTHDMLAHDMSNYFIAPDASSTSYFWAVEFICGGHISVAAMPEFSLQPDFNFRTYLPTQLSAEELQGFSPEVRQRWPQTIQVSRFLNLGDSVLTLGICALFGDQPIQINQASRLRLQETDRLKAMVTELQRVGAKAEEHEDGFTVWPAKPGQLHGADIETYNDHRMAMCFSVLGLKVPGIRIKNPQCVSKTFPNFFEKLEQLRQ